MVIATYDAHHVAEQLHCQSAIRCVSKFVFKKTERIFGSHFIEKIRVVYNPPRRWVTEISGETNSRCVSTLASTVENSNLRVLVGCNVSNMYANIITKVRGPLI
jgi:hypothetical protein